MGMGKHNQILTYAIPALGLLIFAVFALIPFLPSVPYYLPQDTVISVAAFPLLNKLIAALAIVMPVVLLRMPGRTTGRNLAPLVFLPLAFCGYLLPGLIAPAIAANLLFFIPLLVATSLLFQSITACAPKIESSTPRKLALFLFVVLGLFYSLGGWSISARIGEHAVDEGHYLIQTESLCQDGDLDIRNNFGFDLEEAITNVMQKDAIPREAAIGKLRGELHISGNSRDEHWYSWHPYGISLLLVPASPLGMPGRQVVLALIAAAGAVLTFLLCMQVSGSKQWSLITSLLLGTTTFSFAYATRALPEMLGATLLLVAFYSTFLAKRFPLRSLALLMFCCAALLLAHPRFVPCAGLAGLWFLYKVIFKYDIPKRTRRLFIACIPLGMVLAAAYLLINMLLFKNSSSYQTTNLFWVYPEGAWLILFSERGLLYSLPVAAAMLTALFFALKNDKEHRSFHVMVAACLLSMMFSIGTTDCWDGGPTTAGRYLVIVVPLLAPALASYLQSRKQSGRAWILLLFVYSSAYTLIFLFAANRIGADFLQNALVSIKQQLPLLRELFDPYFNADMKIGHPYHGLTALVRNPFPLLLLTTTILLTWPQGKKSTTIRLAATMLFLPLCALLHVVYGRPDFHWSPADVEQSLRNTPLSRAKAIRRSGPEIITLSNYANRFSNFQPTTLTLVDIGQRQQGNRYSQPYIEENGWESKGHRWFTLVAPFSDPVPGPRQLWMVYNTEDDAAPILAIRKGSETIYHQALDRDDPIILETPLSGGDTYILLRLEGENGSINIENLMWCPILPDSINN